MANGFKSGGRQKGTPNKRTVALAERLEALNCDPVSELVSLAQDTDIDPSIRVRCYTELLAYLHPKRKAVEVSGVENPVVIMTSPADVNL
jgi:hypothetical protein